MVEPNDIVVDKYNLDAHANDKLGEKDQTWLKIHKFSKSEMISPCNKHFLFLKYNLKFKF